MIKEFQCCDKCGKAIIYGQSYYETSGDGPITYGSPEVCDQCLSDFVRTLFDQSDRLEFKSDKERLTIVKKKVRKLAEKKYQLKYATDEDCGPFSHWLED